MSNGVGHDEKSELKQRSIELEERYGAHNYHPLDVVIDRAKGVWLCGTWKAALF